jgi:hypothetical protein
MSGDGMPSYLKIVLMAGTTLQSNFLQILKPELARIGLVWCLARHKSAFRWCMAIVMLGGWRF